MAWTVEISDVAEKQLHRLDRPVRIVDIDGIDIDAGKAAIAPVTERFNAPDAQTRDEYLGSVSGQIDQMVDVHHIVANREDAAYAVTTTVPEEVWLTADGSGRLEYGADDEPKPASLADERDSGAITEEEFEARKAELLGRL